MQLAERLEASLAEEKPQLVGQKVLFIRSDKIHARVRDAARRLGISMNDFCVVALEAALDEIDYPDSVALELVKD